MPTTGSELRLRRLTLRVSQRELAQEMGYRDSSGLFHFEERRRVNDKNAQRYLLGLERCLNMRRHRSGFRIVK